MKIHLATALTLGAVPAFAQTYSYDNGTTENAISMNATFTPGEIGMLHGFNSSGGSDVLVEVQIGVGTALAAPGGHDGRPLIVAIWDDPNGDLDPSDAVLLYQNTVTITQSNTDGKVAYPVPNIAVSGSFFIGGIMQDLGDFPVGIDQDSPTPLSSWIVGNGPNLPLDPNNITGGSFGPLNSTDAFLLSATGGGTMGPIGTNYCGPALPNSTGQSGVIEATGSVDVSLNDLTLTASNLPAGQFGYFLASETQGMFAPPGRSAGNLCLAGGQSLGRYVQDVQNSGPGGAFALAIDLTAIPIARDPFTVALQPGDTWYFQAWFRDGGTSNFTDGVAVIFQ